MTLPAVTVREQQRKWALRRGVRLDDSGYTLDVSDNLFAPLSAAARKEFEEADGGELGRPGERGKMQALHSSSALTCNVFAHWRSDGAVPLAEVLEITGPLTIRFERKFPTGLPGKAPNIDVEVSSEAGPMVAIECKFLEPYGNHANGFKHKYFDGEPRGLWLRAGFPRAQALAESLQSRDQSFKWLHPEQLLKHILGLARSDSKWRLVYLWYDVPGPEGVEHAAEVEQFAQAVREDGIDFVPMTYQSLFQALSKDAGSTDQQYIDYLRDRYFADVA
jgi:hypothetical protein